MVAVVFDLASIGLILSSKTLSIRETFKSRH